MKRARLISLFLSLVFLIPLGGCGDAPAGRGLSVSPAQYTFARDLSALDYSALTFTPWETETAPPTQSPRPYTILVYMNGSDLEREGGAATKDMLEMLNSGVLSDYVNLIIFTGGTNRWQNDVIPPRECAIWQLADGEILPVAKVGSLNMGDPGTLAGFLAFGMEHYPAEQYGLIFWDHGGGSIAGYGHDETFNNSALTLLEINYAFERSPLAQTKLAFLGFDACLMATAEMAVVASEYAEVLIASEDLEPGDGWDYSFLSALNADPSMDGATLGRVIVDSYMRFYGRSTQEALSLSVIDLAGANAVMGAMGALMEGCSAQLLAGDSSSFTRLATRRSGTKTFGGGSPRDNDCDMVDLGDMANKLSDLFPQEAASLRAALQNAVIYNRHNSAANLSGLSGYYIFGGREYARDTLATYAALCMSPAYTDYLYSFAAALSDEPLVPSGGPVWAIIGGKSVALYETDRTDTGVHYAAPILLNGREADLIVFAGEGFPGGVVLGARHEEGYVIQKGLDPLTEGDTITTLRPRAGAWASDGELTVAGPLPVSLG